MHMVVTANYRFITAPRALIQEATKKMRMETRETEKVTYYEQPIMLMRQNDKGKQRRKMKASSN